MKAAAKLFLASSMALAAVFAPGREAWSADASAYVSYGGGSQNVQIGIGKSFVVDLPGDAAEVLVAEPKIANAVVRSARKAYIIGLAIGDTDVIFFDADGNQIRSFAVSVGRDLTPIRSNIRNSIPDSAIDVRSVGESVVLTGSVRSVGEAQTAVDIAANLVGDVAKVVNALAIEGRDQVLLKVSVVEMQRAVAKQFGIKLDVQGFGNTITAFGSNPEFPFGNSPGSMLLKQEGLPLTDPLYNIAGNGLGVMHDWGTGALLANIEALESNSLLRTLAEPTLTAISGERADFLAGGEFPVPVPSDDGIGIEYKKYGVSLAFTPIVLSSGRISLQIATEVSEPNGQGTIIAGTAVSGLTVRRANTTVELPSGGSLALAGLLQENTRQAFAGLPGLINMPVLGALFRSRDYQNGQTELVIIVTPYLAKSVHRNKLARPDDGFEPPTDTGAIFLGKLNEVYSKSGQKLDAKDYNGPVGFIVE